MESLERKRFSFALRLPDEVYSFFASNPKDAGKISIDLSTSELILTVSLDSSPVEFTGLLTDQSNLSFFSVNQSKKATYRGQLKYFGILVKPLSLFHKPRAGISEGSSKSDKSDQLEFGSEILSNSIPSLSIGDPFSEGKHPGSFKLHKNHRILTMHCSENAIKLEINRRYGEKKRRLDENQVISAIESLYSSQEIWKIKQISDETLQPESYIRSIMNKIGEKVSKGPYRGSWRLK
jgi:hypothetical protein